MLKHLDVSISRWQAAFIHVGLSALIILSVGGLLVLTWYPIEYIRAVGGIGLIGILAGVDICIGPLLTLIIWDVRKPELKFDIAVIALCQLLALGYGLHAIFQARPVYMVFAKDRFELIAAVDIPEGELAKAERDEFKSLPLLGPKTVGVIEPTDGKERERVLISSISGGADLPQFPQYYVPYDGVIGEVLKRAQVLDRLLKRDEETRNALLDYFLSHKLDFDKVRFLPLRAGKRDQTVLIDAKTGMVLAIVDVDPW
jgi:hypothetical protein